MDYGPHFENVPVASYTFMTNVEDLPVQERAHSTALNMLDTDTCSYVMKRSSEAVIKRSRAVPVTEVCISVITKSELLDGVEAPPRRTQDATALHAFLPYVRCSLAPRRRRLRMTRLLCGPEEDEVI